jgi:hypothetical protein
MNRSKQNLINKRSQDNPRVAAWHDSSPASWPSAGKNPTLIAAHSTAPPQTGPGVNITISFKKLDADTSDPIVQVKLRSSQGETYTLKGLFPYTGPTFTLNNVVAPAGIFQLIVVDSAGSETVSVSGNVSPPGVSNNFTFASNETPLISGQPTRFTFTLTTTLLFTQVVLVSSSGVSYTFSDARPPGQYADLVVDVMLPADSYTPYLRDSSGTIVSQNSNPTLIVFRRAPTFIETGSLPKTLFFDMGDAYTVSQIVFVSGSKEYTYSGSYPYTTQAFTLTGVIMPSGSYTVSLRGAGFALTARTQPAGIDLTRSVVSFATTTPSYSFTHTTARPNQPFALTVTVNDTIQVTAAELRRVGSQVQDILYLENPFAWPQFTIASINLPLGDYTVRLYSNSLTHALSAVDPVVVVRPALAFQFPNIVRTPTISFELLLALNRVDTITSVTFSNQVVGFTTNLIPTETLSTSVYFQTVTLPYGRYSVTLTSIDGTTANTGVDLLDVDYNSILSYTASSLTANTTIQFGATFEYSVHIKSFAAVNQTFQRFTLGGSQQTGTLIMFSTTGLPPGQYTLELSDDFGGGGKTFSAPTPLILT